VSSVIEIIPYEQGSLQWHEFRQKHLGASDSPIYMGASPWETPYGLWQQKLGLKPGPEENDAMRRGKEKEPLAREVFCHRMNLRFEPVVVKNAKYPHLCASMDGVHISNDGIVDAGIEIKIPGKVDHTSAMDGVIPEKYKWQLVQQMIVCDLDMIYYFSWNENSSKIIEFSCDATMKNQLITEAGLFWDCVENLREPALTDRDYITRTDKEFMQAEYDYLDAKKTRQQAEEREKSHRDRLIELAEGKCCKGLDVRLTKYMSRGRVDYNSIPELASVNIEKYRKPNTVAWRIS